MTPFHEIASRIHRWLHAADVPDIDGVEIQIVFPNLQAAWAAKAALCSELAPLTRDLREEISMRAAFDQPFKWHGLKFRFVNGEERARVTADLTKGLG